MRFSEAHRGQAQARALSASPYKILSPLARNSEHSLADTLLDHHRRHLGRHYLTMRQLYFTLSEASENSNRSLPYTPEWSLPL